MNKRPQTLEDHINNLPIMSGVMQRLVAVLSDPDVSMEEMLEVLKLEPTIVAKIIRLANSAYIGVPRMVSSLHNAVVLLGQKKIKSLVMTTQLLALIKHHSNLPFSLLSYWKHVMATALIAESVARHLRRYENINPDEIFTGAIMHDIGKMVLGTYAPERLIETYKKSQENDMPVYLAEELEFSHTMIGEFLAQRWHFPEDIRAIIQFHHKPRLATDFQQRVRIVNVADIMAHSIGFSVFDNEVEPLIDDEELALIKLPLERLKIIARDVIAKEGELQGLVEVFS